MIRNGCHIFQYRIYGKKCRNRHFYSFPRERVKRLYASSISLLSENRSSSFKLHMRSISNSQSALGLPDAIHWSIERRSSGVQVCVRNRMSNCSSIFFYCAYIKKTIEAGGTTWSKTKKNSIYVAEQKNKQEKAFQVFPQKGQALAGYVLRLYGEKFP